MFLALGYLVLSWDLPLRNVLVIFGALLALKNSLLIGACLSGTFIYFARISTLFWTGNLNWSNLEEIVLILILPITNLSTAWKLSVFGVNLIRIFPHSDWIRRDTPYQSKCGKMRTRITPNTATFYAVYYYFYPEIW